MESAHAHKDNKRESSQKKLMENLLSSKFRILNEKLYTCTSEEAVEYFNENPEDFEIYHKGFEIQAAKWPVNPIKLICRELKKKKYKKKLIADMGCGDAFLARNLTEYKIHSFDLVKFNEHITVSDIKNVPLENDSVDLVIFCLSLMGKNFVDFLVEAKRILKNNGLLIVCEITSRIISIKSFISIFQVLEFKLSQKKDVHNYFQLFVFRKKGFVKMNLQKNDNFEKIRLDGSNILKPCLYKKR